MTKNDIFCRAFGLTKLCLFYKSRFLYYPQPVLDYLPKSRKELDRMSSKFSLATVNIAVERYLLRAH